MIGDILGGLGSAAGSLAGFFGQGDNSKHMDEIMDLYRRVREPGFDVSQLSPYELQLVGEYMPEVYEAVVPDEVRLAQEGPEGREAQLGALDYYNQIRREGLPLQDKLMAEQATDAMSRENFRQQGALREEMQRRGMAGGGGEMRARLAQGQASSDLARGMGQDLSGMALARQMEAAANQANLGGQIRGQDLNQALANAQMFNRFNEFTSALLTGRNQDAANIRNQGQLENLAERRRIQTGNTDLANQYQMYNQQYPNQMRQQGFQNELAKIGGMANVASQQTQQANAQDAAMANTLTSIGGGLGRGLGGAADLGISLSGKYGSPKDERDRFQRSIMSRYGM